MQDASLIRGHSSSSEVVHRSLPLLDMFATRFYSWINNACIVRQQSIVTVMNEI